MTSSLAICASAGTGKTSRLVERVLAERYKTAAVVSYTHNNVAEIRKRFNRAVGHIPAGIEIGTWHSFLLRECCRPYQTAIGLGRVESIAFVNGRSAPYVPKSKTNPYFFASGRRVFVDKIAEYILECDGRSGGGVMRRLAQRFEALLIDEFQDLAGWELDLVERLLRSGMAVTFVGDPRQNTYSTNDGSKNSQFRGVGVVKLFQAWKSEGLCELRELATNFRSNQQICDLANELWPGMVPMEAARREVENDEGILIVRRADLNAYVRQFSPQILANDKNANTGGHRFMNFGAAKGLECERVLIIPTDAIKKFIRTGQFKDGSTEKLYVAVTRARRSVAFLYDAPVVGIPAVVWTGG